MKTQRSDQDAELQSYTLVCASIRAATHPYHNKPYRDSLVRPNLNGLGRSNNVEESRLVWRDSVEAYNTRASLIIKREENNPSFLFSTVGRQTESQLVEPRTLIELNNNYCMIRF